MKPVCEHEKETFYHFSSTHSSHCTESLSCNLFCRFLHHHYSRWCSFMSDFDGAATTTEGNPWLTLDGNVRITQARQQRNNINENVFFSAALFFPLRRPSSDVSFGLGFLDAEAKANNRFSSCATLGRLKLPTTVPSYVFPKWNMHAKSLETLYQNRKHFRSFFRCRRRRCKIIPHSRTTTNSQNNQLNRVFWYFFSFFFSDSCFDSWVM